MSESEITVEDGRLTAEGLRAVLRYEPDTGEFFWRVMRGGIRSDFSAGSKHNAGYLSIRIDYKSYLCHRLAWLYMHGVWPKHQVDHINGKRSDNRIVNLRECSNSLNCQNVRAHRDGSGMLGTSFEKRRQKWQAGIGVNGKRFFLGYFETQEEAHKEYLEAKKKYHQFGVENV